MSIKDEIVTVKEAGELLGYSGSVIYKLVKTGKLRHIKYPDKIMFFKSDLICFRNQYIREAEESCKDCLILNNYRTKESYCQKQIF